MYIQGLDISYARVTEWGKKEFPFHSHKDSLEDIGQPLDRAKHRKLPSICRSKKRFSGVMNPNKNSKQDKDDGRKILQNKGKEMPS